MDPFVSTIVKQAVVFGAAVGVVVAVAYFLVQYPKLLHAMSLNMTPPQVP